MAAEATPRKRSSHESCEDLAAGPGKSRADSIGLMTNNSIFRLLPSQVQLLNKKIVDHCHEDSNGQPDAPYLACWILPALEKPLNMKRTDRSPASAPRGPYAKVGYSFAGNYVQTTYTKKDHEELGLGADSFPEMRTFQATHLALVNAGRLPENMDEWQLYNASHLCGRSICVRPDHLVWEHWDKNQSRRMCHVWGAFEACPHLPACLHRAPYRHFLALSKLSTDFTTPVGKSIQSADKAASADGMPAPKAKRKLPPATKLFSDEDSDFDLNPPF